MEKSIIIFGPRNSGKTKLAKELAASYKKIEVVFFNYYDPNERFYFQHCTSLTKLVVVDNLKATDVEDFFNYVSDGINVDRQYQPTGFCHPKFILVCEGKESDFPGASLHIRFDLKSAQ